MVWLTASLGGLCAVALAAVCAWPVSAYKRDVSIVDSLWPLLFLLLAVVYATFGAPLGTRAQLTLGLVAVWSLRLAGYITWRNAGHGEDRRYQAIRARNQPHFAWKSLYLIFLLQAALAWIVSLPLLGAIFGRAPLGVLDAVGVALWLLGFLFETVGDWQLARFKANPETRGRVMDRGLWRYTRHPNYFGDFAIWWGFYALALGAGAAWSIAGPLLMSFLLLKVSGVALLEQDIAERRPGYAEYVRRTPAFFPGKPRD